MADEKTLVLTYEGHEFRVTRDEYMSIRDAAFDDPIEAQRLALSHLANA